MRVFYLGGLADPTVSVIPIQGRGGAVFMIPNRPGASFEVNSYHWRFLNNTYNQPDSPIVLTTDPAMAQRAATQPQPAKQQQSVEELLRSLPREELMALLSKVNPDAEAVQNNSEAESDDQDDGEAPKRRGRPKKDEVNDGSSNE